MMMIQFLQIKRKVHLRDFFFIFFVAVFSETNEMLFFLFLGF